MASASFALDDFVGSLAPTDGKLLYMARVNPILTFASDIVLGVDETLAAKLTDIQHRFIRPIQTIVAGGTTFCVGITFLGSWITTSLRCCRVILAVAYLIYLLWLPES